MPSPPPRSKSMPPKKPCRPPWRPAKHPKPRKTSSKPRSAPACRSALPASLQIALTTEAENRSASVLFQALDNLLAKAAFGSGLWLGADAEMVEVEQHHVVHAGKLAARDRDDPIAFAGKHLIEVEHVLQARTK